MPDPATLLPQDPGMPPPPTTRRPAGPLRVLLQLALGLTVLFGLTCIVMEATYWWAGPSLRGTRAFSESLVQWTADPDALARIKSLWADEIYTYDQLQEAAAVLRKEEWARISPTSNLGCYGSSGLVGLACHSVTIACTQVFTGFMTSAGMCRVA